MAKLPDGLFEAETWPKKQKIILEQQKEQYNKILEQQTADTKRALNDQLKLIEEQQKEIRELQRKQSNAHKAGLKSEENALKAELKINLENLDRLTTKKEQLEEEFQKKIQAEKDRASKIAEQHEINRFKRMSVIERQTYNANIANKLRENKRSLDAEAAAQQSTWKKLDKMSRTRANKKQGITKEQAALDRKFAKEEMKRLESQMAETKNRQQQITDAEKEATNLHPVVWFGSKEARNASRHKKLEFAQKHVDDAYVRVSDAQAKTKSIKEDVEKNSTEEEKKSLEKIAKLKAKLNSDEVKKDKTLKKNLEQQLKKESEKFEKSMEYLSALEEEDAAQHELEMAQQEEKKAAIAEQFSVSELGMSALGRAADNISGHLNDVYSSQSRMKGRLQGSGVSWNIELLDVMTTVGLSGAVKQKNVIAKMVELVDSGVAYNLEMRAFLSEMSDSIASTFDAANGTLLRMIRLQQADTTVARLGMEASLTKLFNQYFKDTSYLTDSGPADAVSAAIMDASATMDKNSSLEFEFNVQKWLGSLYSLGLSSEAVNNIAQGINYLGTGNVSQLSGNSALTTLFAMSAAKAGGKSYARILTEGLDAEDTNKLLRAMVEYLAEIADSQTNMVTKAAYADLFNMSVTDLSTFSSLTSNEISNLYSQNTNYAKLTSETQNQLRKVILRKSIAELMDNVIENAEVGAAISIGSNPVTYGLWKATSILKDYVGKIEIPGITAFGTGLASGLDILNLMQTAMAGVGLIGSLLGGVASMFKGGATNLSSWDFEEYTSRGGGLSLLASGSSEDVSESIVIGTGSGSGEDMSSAAMESGKEAGMEASGTTSEEMEEEKEIPKKIYEALDGDKDSTVIHLLEKLSGYTEQISTQVEGIKTSIDLVAQLTDYKRVFYTAIVGTLSAETMAAAAKAEDLDFHLLQNYQTRVASLSSSTTSNTTGIINNGGPSVTNDTTDVTDEGTNATAGLGVGLEGQLDLSSIIKDAVAEALSEFTFSKSLKVTLDGMPTI